MIQNKILHKASLFLQLLNSILPDITKNKILCIYKDNVNKTGKVCINVTMKRIHVIPVAVEKL
jgi:hypothetical protein